MADSLFKTIPAKNKIELSEKIIFAWLIGNKKFYGIDEQNIYNRFFHLKVSNSDLKLLMSKFSYQNNDIGLAVFNIKESYSDINYLEAFFRTCIQLCLSGHKNVLPYYKRILVELSIVWDFSIDKLKEIFLDETEDNLLPIGQLDRKQWIHHNIYKENHHFVNYYKLLDVSHKSSKNDILNIVSLHNNEIDLETKENIEFIFSNPIYRQQYDKYLNTLFVINKMKHYVDFQEKEHTDKFNIPVNDKLKESSSDNTQKQLLITFISTLFLGFFIFITFDHNPVLNIFNSEKENAEKTLREESKPVVPISNNDVIVQENNLDNLNFLKNASFQDSLNLYFNNIENESFLDTNFQQSIVNNNTINALEHEPLIEDSDVTIDTVEINETDSNNIGYTEYTIQRGDNLFNLAIRFSVSVEELIEINNIDNSSLIYEGDTLLIP